MVVGSRGLPSDDGRVAGCVLCPWGRNSVAFGFKGGEGRTLVSYAGIMAFVENMLSGWGMAQCCGGMVAVGLSYWGVVV